MQHIDLSDKCAESLSFKAESTLHLKALSKVAHDGITLDHPLREQQKIKANKRRSTQYAESEQVVAKRGNNDLRTSTVPSTFGSKSCS